MPCSQTSPWQCPEGPPHSCTAAPRVLSSSLLWAFDLATLQGSAESLSFQGDPLPPLRPLPSLGSQYLNSLSLLNALRYLSLLNLSSLSFVKSRLWTRWLLRSPLCDARCYELWFIRTRLISPQSGLPLACSEPWANSCVFGAVGGGNQCLYKQFDFKMQYKTPGLYAVL